MVVGDAVEAVMMSSRVVSLWHVESATGLTNTDM